MEVEAELNRLALAKAPDGRWVIIGPISKGSYSRRSPCSHPNTKEKIMRKADSLEIMKEIAKMTPKAKKEILKTPRGKKLLSDLKKLCGPAK